MGLKGVGFATCDLGLKIELEGCIAATRAS